MRILLPTFLYYSMAWLAAPAYGSDVFRDCPDCPEMVTVPAGSFVMGSEQGFENERPARKVTVKTPFALGRYEITFDEWQLCVEAKACTRSPDDHQWGKGKRPVMNVTFDDVSRYLAWLSQKSGKRYRLPSEAEWEWAARGNAPTVYPWGDKMEAGLANCRECGAEPFGGFSSAPVGSYPPNGFGLYDMTGNVWEWTQDCWYPDHTNAPADARPRGPETQTLPGIAACLSRVMKGGAWYYFAPMARPAARARNDSRVLSYVLGFRVARDIE